MAKFELSIYGVNDEIIKTYEANRVAWSVFIRAAEMEDKIKNMSALDQLNAIGGILHDVFLDLTDDDLMKADYEDVLNTFLQIVNAGQEIKGGGNSKNSTGVRG